MPFNSLHQRRFFSRTALAIRKFHQACREEALAFEIDRFAFPSAHAHWRAQRLLKHARDGRRQFEQAVQLMPPIYQHELVTPGLDFAELQRRYGGFQPLPAPRGFVYSGIDALDPGNGRETPVSDPAP